jgi:hypothetical protein
MKTLKDYLTPVSVLVFTVVAFIDHRIHRPVRPPSPVPTVTGQVLGRSYAPLLLSGYSDAWLAAAQTLEEGKSVADAQTALQETWKAARVKSFTDHVAPSFGLVLAEGDEPSTPEKRAQVVKLWRDFARGLRGDR